MTDFPRDLSSLARMRRIAWSLVLVERGWPTLWPAVAVVEGFVCLSLLGLPQRLSPNLHGALLVGTASLILTLSIRGIRAVKVPDLAAADRRLERDTRLLHRPLATLRDFQAEESGDPTVWAAHLERAASTARRLRLMPRPYFAAQDRRASRALALLGLCVGMAVAGADAPARLRAAVWPRFYAKAVPSPLRLTAWITPPAYTGEPPILLYSSQPDVLAPVGARLTATVSGSPGIAPILSLAGKATPFQELAQYDRSSSWQATGRLNTGGILEVRRGVSEIGRWYVTAVADVPPFVQWPAEPATTGGRIPQLRLPWRVVHPYGVANLQVEMVLQQHPDGGKVIVDVPLPGGAPRAARGVWMGDLTANPWAGLPIIAALSAQDTGGLTGHSASRAFVLPERRFFNPAARALVSVRKQLALHPQERDSPLSALAALSGDTVLWQADSGGYLNLHAAMNLLARAPMRGEAAERAIQATQERLWQLALQLEEGALPRAEKALAQARQSLHDVMGERDGAPSDPAVRAEMARREQALQKALHEYIQALRRQAEANVRQPAPPEQQAMAAERALHDLQQATNSGTLDQARQQLAELDQALDALEQTQREGESTPQERRRQAERERGRQQVGVLGDLVRREAGLLDRAQARSEPLDASRNLLDFPPGLLNQQSENSAAGQESSSASVERSSDGHSQYALRRALGALMQQFGDLVGKVPHNLGDADQSMRDVQLALGLGDDTKAEAAAQHAIAALEQGGHAMQQQLAQQFGHDGSQSGEGQDAGSDPKADGEGDEGQSGRDVARPRTDPFGRSLQEGAAGAMDGGETSIPDTMEQARTRAIQDELRKRGADRSRSAHELDYIGRLLNAP